MNSIIIAVTAILIVAAVFFFVLHKSKTTADVSSSVGLSDKLRELEKQIRFAEANAVRPDEDLRVRDLRNKKRHLIMIIAKSKPAK